MCFLEIILSTGYDRHIVNIPFTSLFNKNNNITRVSYTYTSLIPSHFIEVPVLGHVLYVLGISNFPISTIFLLNFGTFSTV